jgi:hypothetical protein
VVDVDPIVTDTERVQAVALGGEMLLASQTARSKMEYQLLSHGYSRP